MLYNAHAPLLDRDGNPFTENGTVVTLGMIAVLALDGPVAQGPSALNEKLLRYKLQLRLHGATSAVEITLEEASLIKRCVGDAAQFSPLIVGRVVDELEGIGQPTAATNGRVARLR